MNFNKVCIIKASILIKQGPTFRSHSNLFVFRTDEKRKEISFDLIKKRFLIALTMPRKQYNWSKNKKINITKQYTWTNNSNYSYIWRRDVFREWETPLQFKVIKANKFVSNNGYEPLTPRYTVAYSTKVKIKRHQYAC